MRKSATAAPREVAPSASDYPAWITAELIAATVRITQLLSQQAVSDQQAVNVVLHFAGLLDAVGLVRKTGSDNEKVHGLGPSQQ